MDPVTELAQALREAETFEEAARELLRAGRRVLGGMLADFNARATVRGGMVCLYPDSPRQVIFATDEGGERRPPSRNAWRAIQAHRRPLVLDALTGRMTILLRDDAWVERVGSNETCQRIVERAATHLHVSPLFGPGGVIGLLAFEVAYATHLNFEELVDDEFVDRLMMIAELTIARLALLPRRSLSDPLCDRFVPVAGRLTRSLLQLLDRYADRPDPIVLRGPIGSGRTHLARWVHARSGRTGAFVIFEAAAPGGQSERLEAAWREAEEGTLLIRRPDLLNTAAQARLSAALGDATPAVRAILHADRRWEEAVEAGRFGADLTAQVQDLTVMVAPLRERADEIDDWARHFLALEGGQVSFSADALVVLRARAWGENLQGLRTVVRQARDNALEVAVGPAVIEPHHLARVAYVSQGEPDAARQEATLRAGLEAFAEVLLRAERCADGVRLGGAEGLVLWRLGQLTGSRDEALKVLLGREPSTGNASRTWKRRIKPAIELAEQLALHTLVAELKKE